MHNLGHAAPERNHARLDTNGFELRAAELVRAPGQLHPIDSVVHRHLPAVDPHNLRPRLLVGQRELNLPVEPAAPQQRRVEHVDAVRRREHLDPVVGREAVELVQQLQHRPLDLAVARLFAVEALGAHGVELVDEDDRWRFLLREREAVAHELRSVSNEHLDQLGAGQL